MYDRDKSRENGDALAKFTARVFAGPKTDKWIRLADEITVYGNSDK